MKIAEIQTIPKKINRTPFQQNPVPFVVKPQHDSVSFGRAHENADSLEADTFYDNPKDVHKKDITIRSSAKFGNVTADEHLWVERHLTADNVTSPKVTVGSDARVAGKINVEDFYVGGELTAKSLEAQDACIMKSATTEDSTNVKNLRAWGDFRTRYLEATETTIGGRAIITGDVKAESLTSKGSVLDIYGKSDIGKITSYKGNVTLGEVARLDSIIFANDPDYFLENQQKALWFQSNKIPKKIKIILDKGKQLFIDSPDKNILDRLEFFEFSPTEKDGYVGKPLSRKTISKRVRVVGQEYVPPFLSFLRNFFALGIKDL